MFSPDLIKTNTEQRPPFLIIYAPNGHGKTTFIASIGSTFIVDTEDKCNEIEGAFRYVPETYEDVVKSLEHVLNLEVVPYKAVVIDTIDWLEKIVHAEILSTHTYFDKKTGKQENAKNINDDNCKELNFGKGSILAANMVLCGIMPLIIAIRKKHRIPVIIFAQQAKAPVNSPDVEKYNVIDLRLEPRLAAFLSDKVEAKMYIQIRFNKDHKGVMIPSKERYLITVPQKGIAAKNSLHLPDTIEISELNGWQDFISKINLNKPLRN